MDKISLPLYQEQAAGPDGAIRERVLPRANYAPEGPRLKRSLTGLAYAEHFSSTDRADASGGRPTILHRDLLGVFDLLGGSTLYAISLHLFPLP